MSNSNTLKATGSQNSETTRISERIVSLTESARNHERMARETDSPSIYDANTAAAYRRHAMRCLAEASEYRKALTA